MAGPAHRPPSLLVSSPVPARPVPSSSALAPTPSTSPFRYVQLTDEKPRVLDPLRSSPRASVDHPLSRFPPAPTPTSPLHSPHRHPPLRALVLHPPPPPPPFPAQCRARPRGFRIPDRLKPWLGIGSWAVTSAAFLLAIAFWKKEVFTALDHLALYLQSLGNLGHAILFCLIFITTIPPFPLYSTLIILSGYTFGTWTGAAISYTAALSGAAIVFLLSRHYLREYMSRLLKHTLSLQRVVRAIERRPKLLLLIRVAPYPYNLMNVLLAASHTLSFQTYFTCTALSLLKVVVHTSLGASMHSFAGFHHAGDEDEDEDEAQEHAAVDSVARAWTVGGIVLCVAILVYLSWVARRAVDEELEGEPWEGYDAEERAAEMREVATAADRA